jgi:hypothetical protein
MFEKFLLAVTITFFDESFPHPSYTAPLSSVAEVEGAVSAKAHANFLQDISPTAHKAASLLQ